MQLRPQNKALGIEATKDESEAIDAGLALYPPEEGWRPVFDRSGQRYGFYRNDVGLKDDPCCPRWSTPAPDGVMERVYVEPEYIAARAAVDEAARVLVEAQSDYEAARAAVSAFSLQVDAGVPVEHPKGSSKYVLVMPDGSRLTFDEMRGRRRLLEDQASDIGRRIERAERDWAVVNAACHRVGDRLSRAIREGR